MEFPTINAQGQKGRKGSERIDPDPKKEIKSDYQK